MLLTWVFSVQAVPRRLNRLRVPETTLARAVARC
jgi:hypothetical protein